MVKLEIFEKMGVLIFLLIWSLILNLTYGHSLFTCEPIIIPRCSGMTYNMTFFPNMMGHYDQDTAASHLKVSFVLVHIYKQFFL